MCDLILITVKGSFSVKRYLCVHRVCKQRPAGWNVPECVCFDGAVWPGVGGRVPAAAAEDKHVTRGRCRGWTLSLHWKG